MKPRRFHGLKRPKIRQSWNKYNLYNLANIQIPDVGRSSAATFFQQKWRAKGLLRAYHGEHVVERKWTRMFSRRLLGVVNMDARYMARYDGSELAAGRGSGRHRRPRWGELEVGQGRSTPYMQMTFAPMERRLDIAVFRAMFASSARQAKQFCVHGAVKVNGKVMHYPSYRLNPGDMFQVDPERVLHATGAPKLHFTEKEREKRQERRAAWRQAREAAETEEQKQAHEALAAYASASKREAAGLAAEAEQEQDPDTTDAPEAPKADMKPTKEAIMALADRAKTVLKEEDFSATQKHRLRFFVKSMKRLVSMSGRPSATPAAIADELSAQLGELRMSVPSMGGAASAQENAAVAAARSDDPSAELSKEELRTLEQRIAQLEREDEENPHDADKPYRTPWRPRQYMSPFAFIPKYLEVNQNICAAVYLRHPVARAGRAEVPTPFSEHVSQLAYSWYLRRR